ncbi:unnamed protein product [Pylaiella littoralis]
MAPWKEYTVSVEEIHHTEKKDAPSGTAITIAEGILEHSDKKTGNSILFPKKTSLLPPNEKPM